MGLFCSLLLPIFDILLVRYYYRIGKRQSEKKFILFLFINALFVRIIGVFVMKEILMAYMGMPFLSYKDDYIYNNESIEIMHRWELSGVGFYDDIAFSSNTYSGFPNFSAALMFLFGPSPLVPRIGNAVLSTFTVILGYLICRKYAPKKSTRFIGVLLAYLPLTITFSALQLKDTLLLFFTVLGIYSCINILQNHRLLLSILLLVISLIGISFGRPATIVPVFGALIITIIYNIFSRYSSNNVLKLLSIIITIALLVKGYQYLETIGFVSVSDYFDSRYKILSESSIYDSKAQITRYSFAKYLGAPLYLLGALFLPPAVLVDVGETINYSAWVMLEHYAFLPFIIPAIFVSFTNRKTEPIPFYLLIVYLLFKIGQANSVLTSLSVRQSLGTLFVMYLMLPMYRPPKKHWTNVIVFVSLFIIAIYNMVRLYTHGMLLL